MFFIWTQSYKSTPNTTQTKFQCRAKAPREPSDYVEGAAVLESDGPSPSLLFFPLVFFFLNNNFFIC